ncbi:MAG: arginine--tRNA ligase, partial [Candidatus Methanomethylophilaceae archaeon]|nr:arginine--tRNA ligase [Candidatus Methanomethylophilaceae archaeon]
MTMMDRFSEEVKTAVHVALQKIGAEVEFQTEIPPSDAADLAVPCFQMSKALRKAPAAIAEELASNIEVKGLISSVTALNGYLNFKMDEKALFEDTISTIIEQDECYGSHPSKGIRVNVEHT